MSATPREHNRALAAALGASCRRARHAARWSQESTAERLSMCTEFYGRIERGQALPALNTSIRLVHVLGISLDAVRAEILPESRRPAHQAPARDEACEAKRSR